MTTTVQLYRALSKLGYASRTQALALIRAGEISVNGVPCRDPDKIVTLETTRICHQGVLLQAEQLRIIMLYKPRGTITSRHDEQERPTVYSLLPPELQSLHCVGRLDWATSGLLLLTNSTLLSAWLTNPKNNIPRIYVVTVRGMMTSGSVAKLQQGITDNGQLLKPDALFLRKSSRKESHLVITLSEGKNREVRRLCKSTGNEVTRLKRVAYGTLDLGNLAPKCYREVVREELAAAFPAIPQLILVQP